MRSRLSGRVAETVSRDTLAIPYPLSIGVLAGKHEDLPSLLTVCHFPSFRPPVFQGRIKLGIRAPDPNGACV